MVTFTTAWSPSRQGRLVDKHGRKRLCLKDQGTQQVSDKTVGFWIFGDLIQRAYSFTWNGLKQESCAFSGC